MCADKTTAEKTPAEKNGVFAAQERIIAIGDLHGDLQAFFQCLRQCSNVIDDKWNWIGGNTYVVLVGDMVDRHRPGYTYLDKDGKGLGEVDDEEYIILKHICRLNRQAIQKGGGRVLKLLGNHELMNVALANFQYATPYELKRNKKDRRLKLKRLLVECGLYGAVQIGSWLFCHGGILEFLFDPPEGKNFFARIQQDAKEFNDKSRILETVLWDRTWSEPKSTKATHCKRLTHILDDLLLPHIQANLLSSSDDATAKRGNLKLVVAHTVQANRKQGYIPQQRKVEGDAIVLSGPLQFVAHQKGMGINADCAGRLWRIDVGMSRAFQNKADSQEVPEYRRPQVLQILHDDIAQITILRR